VDTVWQAPCVAAGHIGQLQVAPAGQVQSAQPLGHTQACPLGQSVSAWQPVVVSCFMQVAWQ